ncbi:MAG: GerAB/ArcD/ProY family transporter, partial [Clostridiales bacterium]|nr:GerAB/ArcD/ProY family transporter [Clostridiales bacterium]
MESKSKMKISSRHAYLLFLVASFSPSIRLTSRMCAELGKQTGWVSIIISCVVYCGLILMYHDIFKDTTEETGLYEIFKNTVSKPA